MKVEPTHTFSDRVENSRNNISRVSQSLDAEVTRRELLSGSILLAASVAASGLAMIACRGHDDNPNESSFAGGEFLNAMDFVEEGSMRMDVALGAELDGRLFFDHSALSVRDLVTPSDKFYVRTRASTLIDSKKPWSVTLGGTRKAIHLSAKELHRRSEPLGKHLMECAGNAGRGHFGLISVANWNGVPVLSLLDQVGVGRGSARVRISGFDTYLYPSTTSVPGASWIFSVDDFAKSGSFLATKMNGELLTLDHGAPIRLVVPGWYGCCCIKWVNEITAVEEGVVATSQMQEYSGRTHQNGTPILARDHEPAIIDAAAMPIRVERWKVNGRIQYKIIGIQWGGTQPVKSLKISFNGGVDWRPVKMLDEKLDDSWVLWAHGWAPKSPGNYRIRLKVADPMVRTRRLDMGYYDRVIHIPAD